MDKLFYQDKQKYDWTVTNLNRSTFLNFQNFEKKLKKEKMGKTKKWGGKIEKKKKNE